MVVKPTDLLNQWFLQWIPINPIGMEQKKWWSIGTDFAIPPLELGIFEHKNPKNFMDLFGIWG